MSGTDESVRVENGGLANVLVRIKGAVPGAPPSRALAARPIVVGQKDCTFTPRVQGALSGQKVLLQNEDGTLHNVRLADDQRFLFNVAQRPKGPPVERPLPEAEGVLSLKCDIHPWMRAWVVMSPHGYFATTDASGHFELEDLPAGTYTLEAWHESLGTQTAQVTVAEAGSTEARLAFAAH